MHQFDVIELIWSQCWCTNLEVCNVSISRFVMSSCCIPCCSSLKPNTDVDATRKSTLKKGSKVDFSIPGDPNAPAVEGEVGEGLPENQDAQERWFHLPSSLSSQNASDQSLMVESTLMHAHGLISFQSEANRCVILRSMLIDTYGLISIQSKVANVWCGELTLIHTQGLIYFQT